MLKGAFTPASFSLVESQLELFFSSWCVSFGPVRMQQSHSGAHQKRTKQAYLLEEVVSARFQTNPGAVRLW